MNYLGCPLGGNYCNKAFWTPLIEKFNRKLEVWKRFTISKEGRVAHVQSILSSLQAPTSTIKAMEKISRDFIWSGNSYNPGSNLVKWEWTSLPMSHDGLGIGAL